MLERSNPMQSHSHPIRVLVRPPAALPPQPPPTPPPVDTHRPPKNGVVVVGFIGKRHHDVAHLINKIVDSHVFGSGNSDAQFRFEPDKINPEMSKWFERRRLSYYHDGDQGILYLQYSDSRVGFEPAFEDPEFGDLQGLMFMFSVCHVIILIQEGSRFDTQMLKKFRALQAAKPMMASFVKSQSTPHSTSRAHPSRASINPTTSPKNPSPGKTRGIPNRHSSSITVMSGLGSHTSLLPGQCTPVVLFVYIDDFTESGNTEVTSENKGSGPVLVLARLANKFEAGLRKKLQSSLEAQIRFSIKKCRVLSGPESGSRSGGPFLGSASLFYLDTSRAVLLVDSLSCRSGESLESAIGLVEEVLDGKLTLDSLLQENVTTKEDILSVKEFIHRQQDLLRGKGSLVSSGAGIFAAAVSAASKKTLTAPELPTFETWLSSCHLILHGILSANEDPLLQSGVGINDKFSTSWCEKAFPAAKEVYLDNLPPCYPSSEHEEHLKQALQSLTSMAKGPTLPAYMKKLNDECTSIWVSGRQLCDAISLTGKPCVHQRHGPGTLNSVADIKSHSSGFVYLNACACGRTRRVRPDPFDFETANSLSDAFAECDKLLPSVALPGGRGGLGPAWPSPWDLIRVGSSKYYDPSKGLLQSGFCSSRKFLLRWVLFLEKPKETSNDDSEKVSLDGNIRVENAINGNTGNNASVGRGLINFAIRKPFSEVVAGRAAASSAFPPLLTRKQNVPDPEKGVKLGQSAESQLDNGNDFPRISNNFVPLDMKSGEQVKAAGVVKHGSVYLGFEHECPHGHRFILSEDHLSELAEENNVLSMENPKQEPAKTGKTGVHGKNRRQSNGIYTGKVKNMEKSREKMSSGNTSFSKSSKLAGQDLDQTERTKVTDRKLNSVDDSGCGFSLINRNLPIYMNCPYCWDSATKNEASSFKFASTISQLQRIFVVTPSFPIVLAADPIIQFELSCLPTSVPDRERKLQFRLSCPVILPPDSFLSLRLPFIYGVTLDDGSLHSLQPFESQPQLTASIVKGTALRVVSDRSSHDPASVI